MITLIEAPYVYSFSENEIRYVFDVTDPTSPGCAVEVELYYQDAGTTKLLIKNTLTPDADGLVYCHVRDYLKSLLKPQLPHIPGQVFAEAITQQVRFFYIKYREVTNAAPDTAWVEDANLKTVLMGGVEKMKFKRNNFFISYQQNNLSFLTWQPNNQFVYYDQPHYLTLLITGVPVLRFNVNVKTVFADGAIDTSKTYLQMDANTSPLWRIDASAKSWGLAAISPAKKIHYYEVSVTNALSGHTLATPYRFYLQYNPVYSFWDFNYFNSLGGLDAVRIVGETDIGVDSPSDELEHIIYKDQFDSQTPQAQFSSTNAVKKDSYKGDAGFFNRISEQESLVEILISKGIYEVVDGRWIKVLNMKKSQDLRKTTDKKWSFPVEWSYGYQDQVFTPKRLMLGQGYGDAPPVIIGPVCSPVTIPTLSNLPDATVGEAYTYSLNLGGDAPFVLTGLNKPSWMSVNISGSTVNFTGTPDASASGVSVSFSISNCSAVNMANFNSTINVLPAAVQPFLVETDNTSNGTTRTQTFAVGPNVTAGDSFNVGVYSVVLTVIAVAGDTPSTIAAKLAAAVNNTTAAEWNANGTAPAPGTPGFPPNATSSGNILTITLNFGNQFFGSAY